MRVVRGQAPQGEPDQLGRLDRSGHAHLALRMSSAAVMSPFEDVEHRLAMDAVDTVQRERFGVAPASSSSAEEM